MPSPAKGRPALSISEHDRALVRAMAADNARPAAIAERLGVSLPTLRKYFAAEMAGADAPLFAGSDAPIPPASAPPRERKPRAASGRKAYQPIEADRRRVVMLLATNTKHEVIASVLGISVPTFAKAFREEIEIGVARKRADTLAALDRKAQAGSVAAQKALLDILDQGEMDRLGESFTGEKAPKLKAEPKPETIGKKATSAREAHDIANDPEWRDLLKDENATSSGFSTMN